MPATATQLELAEVTDERAAALVGRRSYRREPAGGVEGGPRRATLAGRTSRPDDGACRGACRSGGSSPGDSRQLVRQSRARLVRWRKAHSGCLAGGCGRNDGLRHDPGSLAGRASRERGASRPSAPAAGQDGSSRASSRTRARAGFRGGEAEIRVAPVAARAGIGRAQSPARAQHGELRDARDCGFRRTGRG